MIVIRLPSQTSREMDFGVDIVTGFPGPFQSLEVRTIDHPCSAEAVVEIAHIQSFGIRRGPDEQILGLARSAGAQNPRGVDCAINPRSTTL